MAAAIVPEARELNDFLLSVAAEVGTVIDPLLRELDRLADAARVGHAALELPFLANEALAAAMNSSVAGGNHAATVGHAMSRRRCVRAVCRRSAGRVQSPSLTGYAGAYMQGGRVWQRITVYVLGRLAGEYGIVRMPGSRGYGIALLFRSIAAYRR